METNQTYKLLRSKGNHEKMKRQLMEWEKILANDVTECGLISKILQTAHITQLQKTTTTTTKKN